MAYFTGELMKCCMCGAIERSDPHVESQWRVVELDGRPFYACPNEFPPDGASAHAFEAAYRRVMLTAIHTHTHSPGAAHA